VTENWREPLLISVSIVCADKIARKSQIQFILLGVFLGAAGGSLWGHARAQQGQKVVGRRKLGQKVDGCVRMSHILAAENEITVERRNSITHRD
jgi:hypothetical protein